MISGRVGSQLTRALLALVAILLIAWFVVLFRNERIGSDAADRVFRDPGMSDSEWAHTLDQFRRAELLDPSTGWTVQRAGALLLRDRRAAIRVADSVLHDEPDNFEAWLVVYRATRGRDARRASQAIAEVRRLDPLVSQR